MRDKVETEFPASVESAGDARRFLTRTLLVWSCEPLVDKAQLLVSELVINAVSYAHSPALLRMILTDSSLRVEVHDSSAAFPQPRTTTPDQPDGRGLAIVAALADRWGVEAAPQGKSVWFELELAG